MEESDNIPFQAPEPTTTFTLQRGIYTGGE